MLLKNFCCCCHLRTGTIIFAWLQMMFNVLILAGAASLIPYSFNLNEDLDLLIHMSFALLIGETCMKSVACLALIWGVIKRNHFFMQPWVFLQLIESIALSVLFFALFVTACFKPIFFAGVSLAGIFGILHWYFWVCVKSLYNKDHILSHNVWGDVIATLQYRNSLRHPSSFGPPIRQ